MPLNRNIAAVFAAILLAGAAARVSADVGGDMAAYLTGARSRFGSHLIDPQLRESDFVVQRQSTGQTVRVVINAATYPKDVRDQMKKIESGKFEPADIDRFQDLQWAYARKLVSRPAAESVDLTANPDYTRPAPARATERA